jgi:hypothetical protein
MKKRGVTRRDALKAAAVTAVAATDARAGERVPTFMLESLGQLTVKLTLRDRDGKSVTRSFELGALSQLAGSVGDYSLEVVNARPQRTDVLAKGAFRVIYSLE